MNNNINKPEEIKKELTKEELVEAGFSETDESESCFGVAVCCIGAIEEID
jgi:hypothetical protein